MNKYILAIILSLLFFIAQFITLHDYGISWDETLHFQRGQAYLHYFLTGKLNYNDLHTPRRSFYQDDTHNGEFFITGISAQRTGHPPLNDDLAALLNHVFFQKLGIMDDISSYHLFNILISTLLVFIVVSFALETFGVFAAIISFLALVTYPLFWAEAHFNIKDPIEAAFFAGTIWSFYHFLETKKIPWLFTFFIFIAFALGTKFNVVFLPFILAPYLLVCFPKLIKNPVKTLMKIPSKFWLSGVMGIILIIIIFIASWPSLWQNFPTHLVDVLKYYRSIGSGYNYQPAQFFILGFNTFPILWILFTTPPIVLVITFLGFLSIFFIKGKKRLISLLWLLWLVIPIIRVSLPGASIYGGIRQIMEFLPALTLLAGLGAWWTIQLVGRWKLNNLAKVFLVLIFIYPTLVLVKMHPNENVYFNFLIGGLKGAEVRNFPSWGNSLGNAYQQGINWLNENAVKGAKVSLIQGTKANAPLILFRPDLDYDITNFSGIERQGEYLMELIFNDTGKDFYYRWEYVENFLVPIYELEVDGVAILKIWKNDLEHTKSEYRFIKKPYLGSVEMNKDSNFIRLGLEKEILLSGMDITLNSGCIPVGESFMEDSIDGQLWHLEKDPISSDQLIGVHVVQGDHLKFLFPGRKAKFIRFQIKDSQACHLDNVKVKFDLLEKIT